MDLIVQTDRFLEHSRVVAGCLSCYRDSTLFISASFSIQNGTGSNIVIPVGALEPLLFAGASPGRETAGTHHSHTHACPGITCVHVRELPVCHDR